MVERVVRAWRHGELSDLLSPIVVKEMRQGVRKNVFAVWLLLLQGLMVLAIAFALAAPGEEVGTALFWMGLVVPVLLAPASAGAMSLAEERKLNTLELLVLTPLTPRRVVFGKWAAAFAQTLLLACGVTPYLLLRYFLGGVDIVAEGIGFLALLMASALLTALGVGQSAVRKGQAGGGAVMVLGVLFLLMLAGPIVGMVAGAGPLGPWIVASAVAVGLTTLAILLEASALGIAHPAQQRPWLLRLLALGTVGLARGSAEVAPDVAPLVWSWAAVVTVVVAVAALGERCPDMASPYQTWLGRGPLRELAGVVLAPGWPSGVAFVGLLGIVWMLLFVVPGGGADTAHLAPVSFLMAGLLMPVPFLARLRGVARNQIALWLLLQGLMCLPAAAGGLLVAAGVVGADSVMPALVAIHPIMAFFAALDASPSVPVLSVVVAATWLALAARAAWRAWRRTREMVLSRTRPAPAAPAVESAAS